MKYNLNLLINTKKFGHMIENFSKFSKVEVSVFDYDGTMIISSGEKDYVMNYILAQSIYNKNADVFFLNAPSYIKNTLDLVVYAIPIEHNNEKYGYIILGPVYFTRPEDELLRMKAGELGFDYNMLHYSLEKVPCFEEKNFETLINFVVQFKNYVVDSITEKRKRNEISNQFKKAQKIAHMGNWEMNLVTRKTKWSAEFASIFGLNYFGGVILSDEIINTIHPDDRERVISIYKKTFANGIAQDVFYRIIRKDNGQIRHIYHKWEFQNGKEGKPEKIFGIVQDITEMKRIQIEKVKSEERFRHVTANAGVWIWEVDSKGLFTYSNDVVYKLLGYTPEELLNKAYFFELSDQKYREEYKSRAIEIFNRAKPFNNFVLINISKEGKEIIVDSSGTPVYNENGKLTGYRGICNDITERTYAAKQIKRSEEKFRAVFENAGIGIFLADNNGCFIKCNGAFLKMLEYSAREIINIPVSEILYPDEFRLEWSLFAKIALSRRENYQFEKQIKARSGKHLWAQIIISAVNDENGKLLYSIGMVENITERKQSLEKIEKMNLELKELNNTKDKFFSIIAHDLKSPFQGMIGLSEILIDPLSSVSEAKKHKHLSLLHTAIVKQYELLQNLLGWAQMQLGKISFSPERIFLDEFSKEAISILYSNAEKKNIIILNEIENRITVFADANMLRSVFQNFVTNAIKFTNNNGLIRIYAEKKDGFANISVEDNGVGINRESIIKITSPKYHYSTNGTNGEPGTGLGVLLCKDMIEKNNGKLNIFSEPGKGTNITFSLPLAD